MELWKKCVEGEKHFVLWGIERSRSPECYRRHKINAKPTIFRIFYDDACEWAPNRTYAPIETLHTKIWILKIVRVDLKSCICSVPISLQMLQMTIFWLKRKINEKKNSSEMRFSSRNVMFSCECQSVWSGQWLKCNIIESWLNFGKIANARLFSPRNKNKRQQLNES